MQTQRKANRLAVLVALIAAPVTAGAAVQTFDANFDLTVGSNYDAGTGVTPDNTTDILIGAAYPVADAIFQLGTGATATNLAGQSLNSTSGFAVTIGNNSSNATASNATLTLGNPAGQANAVSGAAATDLLYVGGTGNLTLQAANLKNGQTTGTGTMSVVLAQSGTINVANAATTLNIISNISGAYSLTKTGAGTLSLNGSNTYSDMTIKQGTLSVRTSSGVLGNGAVVLGDTADSNSATLLLNPLTTSGSTSHSNDIIVQAGTTGLLRIATSGTFGNSTLSGDITLNNNVTLSMNRSAERSLIFSGIITGNGTISTGSANNSNNAGVQITGANATSFTGNVVVGGGILGFNENSLGQNSTGGTIAFNNSVIAGNPGLAWLGANTQDLSGRFQALGGGTTVTLDTRTNNVVFATADGLSGPSNSVFSKQNAFGAGGTASTGTLTLAAANTAFLGQFNTAANGATILAHANALRNATLNVGAGPTQTTGGVMFSSANASGAFNLGNLTGAGSIWLNDELANNVSITLGYANSNGNYSGTLTGGSAITKVGTGSWTLNGVATMGGPLSILGGQVTVSNAGRVANATSYLVNQATFLVDNNGTVTPNRLAAVAMTLHASTYSQTGKSAASTPTTETLGAVTLGSGTNFLTLTQGTATATTNTLAINSLTRSNRAVALMRGSGGLGQQPSGSNTSTILSNATNGAADLIGGTGTFASGTASDIAIVPYLIGDNNASGSSGTTLVSYDTTNGSYRTLKTGEYLNTFTGAGSTTNVRLSSGGTAHAITAGTYNSLFINESSASGAVTATADGVVTLNSGVLLFGKSAGTARAITFTGGQLQFATDVAGVSRAEGIISSVTGADVQFDTQISASGGVTFNTFSNTTASTITLNSAANDWTGQTTVNGNLRVNAISKLGDSQNVYVAPNGVLTLNGNSTIDDGAILTLANGAMLSLAFADGMVETVDRLVLGSTVINYPTTFNLANNWGGYGNAAGSYFADSTGGLTVVPEPAAMSLLALGLTGLLKRRRRIR